MAGTPSPAARWSKGRRGGPIGAASEPVAESAAEKIISEWALAPSYAATLLPSATDALQLYGRYLPDGTLAEFQLRYVCTDGAGEIITDVMLGPISEPIG
jgi:hypothetical protein